MFNNFSERSIPAMESNSQEPPRRKSTRLQSLRLQADKKDSNGHLYPYQTSGRVSLIIKFKREILRFRWARNSVDTQESAVEFTDPLTKHLQKMFPNYPITYQIVKTWIQRHKWITCKNGTPAGQKGKKLYDAVAKEFAKNCKVSFRCKRLGKTTEALTNKKSDASSSKVKQRRMLKQCSARGTLRKKITNLQGQKQRETICEERTQKLTLFSRGVGKYFDHWQPLYKLSFSVRKIVMKALAELRKPQVESNIEEEVKKSLNLRLPRIKVEKVVEEEITLEEPDVGNELLAMPNLESSAGNPETVKTVESVVDGENASVVLEPPLNLDGTAEEEMSQEQMDTMMKEIFDRLMQKCWERKLQNPDEIFLPDSDTSDDE